MAKTRDNFRLGLAVLTMVGLLFAFVVFIGGGYLDTEPKTRIAVRFDAGNTLPEFSEGALVRYLGQVVGTVDSTRIVEAPLDPQRPDVTDAVLEVLADVQQDIDLRVDTTIVATAPPLGGTGTLTILRRGQSSDRLTGDTPVIAAVRGFDAALQMLTEELDEKNEDGLLARVKLQLDPNTNLSIISKLLTSMDDLNRITELVALELSREQNDALMSKVHVAVDKLNASLTEVHAVVKDNRGSVDHALASFDSAITTFDEDIAKVLAREFELEAQPDKTVLARIHSALAKLDDSLANVKDGAADLKTVAGDAKRVLSLNKERISAVVANVGQASADLKSGIKDISRNPWKLLFEPGTAEKRELHIYSAAREFAEAAASLDDVTMRIQSLVDATEGDTIPADDPDLVTLRADLGEATKRFSAAEDALFDALNSTR